MSEPPIDGDARHQLPAPPANLTGRVVELAELRAAVKQHGAAELSLRGAGGVGKTALALVLARELAGDYPDAQLFLDLQGTAANPLTPAAVMAYVIHSYQPTFRLPAGDHGPRSAQPPTSPQWGAAEWGAELQAIYRGVLGGQRALLLLDNAAGHAQVAPLAGGLPPGCLLLVTSRLRFNLPDSYAFNLDGLPPADAAALLLKWAPRIGDQATEIAELCVGPPLALPLAIRLAGGALAVCADLQPADYIARLRGAHLGRAPIDAVLDVSYDLLPAELQPLWRDLSVFPLSFDPAAAAAVWALDSEAAGDRLARLLGHGLVELEAFSQRYQLHELVRPAAEARLEPAERDEAGRRHAAHFLNVLARAEGLYRPGGESALRGLALFDRERPNLQAGQAWAAAQAPADAGAASLSSDYPSAGAQVLDLRLSPRERVAWLEAGLAAARHVGNRRRESIYLSNLASACLNADDPRQAIEYYEQGLSLDRELGDRGGEGNTLSGLGIAYANLGDSERAIEYFEQHLHIAREIGDRRGEDNVLGNLGNVHLLAGQPQDAIVYYEDALSLDRELGDRRSEANDLWNLALAWDSLGNRPGGLENGQAALLIFEELADAGADGVRRQLSEWQAEGGRASAPPLRAAV
jgi:tetratricopeptide (TPR) repeat protein